MNCGLAKQSILVPGPDGIDVWDRTEYYQKIRDIEHSRISKHFDNLTDAENATYETCDFHRHWVHFGKGYRFTNHQGEVSLRDFGECITGLCPDWADKHPEQAIKSSLRATAPDPWSKLSIALADVSAFHAAKDFCKSDFQSLVIHGPCGYGKTSLAKMVESDFLRSGLETCFVSCERLAQTFLEVQPTRNEIDIDARQIILDMRRSDVVVIDDLGTVEKEYTEFFKEQFKMFLDERRGKIIITTNLNRPQLVAKLNDKIVSRIFENCRIVNLKGKDYRRGS
jgi:nucleoside-triphosphatase THEP1